MNVRRKSDEMEQSLLRRADVMELADMRDLGSRVARRGGSSPFIRTSRDVLTAFEVVRTFLFAGKFCITIPTS